MIKILELFGGIGACSKALENLNIDYEIADYVEIDKYAVKSFNAIHNTDFEPQDITTWNKDIDVDLIMHGSPCQDFSISGKQAGGDEGSGTRSSLMYETIRIVNELKPKYVIWENVKNLLSNKHKHNFDAYIEAMSRGGYNSYYQILNAKDYGIPQNRERVFTISIRKDIDKGYIFPKPIPLKLKLKDLLEDNVDEKYYLSDKMIDYISKNGTSNFKNPDCKINLEIARPLTTVQNKRAGTTNYISNELPNNCDLQVIREGGLYGNRQGGSIYNKNGLCPTITTEASQNWNILVNDSENDTFVEKKYANFLNKKGYLPRMFNPYNEAEITDVAPTQTTQCGSKTSSSCVLVALNRPLKIRKLTPKECWRLMGFDDEDFEKAEKVNSNAQLYKQAGNSIVVNVLMEILKKLLKEGD